MKVASKGFGLSIRNDEIDIDLRWEMFSEEWVWGGRAAFSVSGRLKERCLVDIQVEVYTGHWIYES